MSELSTDELADVGNDIITVLKAERDRAEASLRLVEAERDALKRYADDTQRILADPAAVRINLLQGTIAKPDDIVFFHDTSAPVAELRAEIEALKHDIGRHMDALLAAEEALNKEREECAALCDDYAEVYAENGLGREAIAAEGIAAAIRSRTQEEA